MSAPGKSVVVPVEPTQEMVDRAQEFWPDIRDMWAAMLAAAPAAPQAAGVGEDDGAWIIVFEDRDREQEVFTGFGARDAAQRRYDQVTVSWNAHLFERVRSALPLRAPSREPEGGAEDERLHSAISKLKDWVGLIQLRKNGGCVSGNPIVDCVNDLPAIIRELEAAELEIEGAFERYEDALATREEAPAEAGEIGAEYDAAAHCVTLAECPPGLFLWNGTLGFKSEYGAMEPVGISPHHQLWKVGNRADAYCADSGEYFWGGTSNHDDRAKLLVYPIAAETVAMVASHGPSALRAQPQAREDAQPVAGAKALAFFKWARDFFWCEEGCEIDGGDFQNAAERFGLIVKVPFDPDRHSDNGYGLEAGDDWYETAHVIDQALAALQAEQGAK